MTMMKTANVNVRIQQDIKQQAESILSKIGLPRSVAIDLYYRQIIMHNGIPFPLTISSEVPVRSLMSEEEFNKMMLTGYEQVMSDEGYSVDEVFDELEAGL